MRYTPNRLGTKKTRLGVRKRTSAMKAYRYLALVLTLEKVKKDILFLDKPSPH
ncbi:MAG TPA: hypothetical protein VNL13_02170 [Sulfolobales archaeon]|nr:hypothetical protein [Sulfolobales archaeon]